VMSMVATHPIGLDRGTPSGIRTRDLHLERVTSWAARLWGQRREEAIASNDSVNTVAASDHTPPKMIVHRGQNEPRAVR
jgi:hypothetical protein